MAEAEKKGLTVKIDADLHAEVRQYLYAHEMTMAEFVTMALQDELHPKNIMKEGTTITHASFDHTTLRECVFDDVVANSTIFHAAKIREGSFTGTAFEDCDFSDAKIIGAADFDSVNYCCIDGTEFIDMDEGYINFYNCYDDRETYLQTEGYSSGPSM